MDDPTTLTIRPARPDDADRVEALLNAEDLEAEFVPEQFVVATRDSRIVGCARIKPLAGGGQELASIAVATGDRGHGTGTALVEAALARTDGPVHALALAPGLLARHGFSRTDEVPAGLRDKLEVCCRDRGAVPMVRPGHDPAHEEVRATYAGLALGSDGEAGPGCCAPATPYDEEVLARIPDEAQMGLGTGHPVGAADVQPGETVVDLGSGAGVDVFIAADRVGPTGHAVGVDLTPEMVERARRLAREHGFDNVAFHQAPIEDVPLADGVADVVVSNCVVNLSSDKDRALGEAHRLLGPGGRLAISDTVRVHAETADGCGCGCTAGAWTADRWRNGLERAGFVDVQVDVEPPTGRFGPSVGTATIRARKPPGGDATTPRSR